MGSDIARSFRELQELVRQSEEEICLGVARKAGYGRPVEVVFAVHVEVVFGVVLVRNVNEAPLQGVLALDPGQRILPRVRVVDQERRAFRTQPGGEQSPEKPKYRTT